MTIVLAISIFSCIVLQALSKNLFFVIVAGAGLLTIGSVETSQNKNRWQWCIPAFALNIVLTVYSLFMYHQFYNINDYLLCAVLLLLFTIAMVVQLLPTKKRPPVQHGRSFLHIIHRGLWEGGAK